MSYILDALRRADSERERGAVPSLHANPVALDEDDDGQPPRSSPLLWAVVVLSLLLACVLAWLFLGRDTTEPAPAVAPTPLAATPPAAVAAPPLAVEQPQPVETHADDVPTTSAPPRAVTTPLASPTPRAMPKAPALTAAAPASAVTERPVSALNDLPESVRRELPQLAVGGAMYSGQASNRMLILNGQIFHEGDTVAAGLVLEQIKLKSAVLAYKGYRYSISY